MITDREWLDIAWKYFQQHAQQRVQHFNFFITLSAILSTGLLTTFQSDLQAPLVGIGIGLIQAQVSFIFYKIDNRNRFLTKLSENVLKRLELDTIGNAYKLFTEEEKITLLLNKSDKSRMFFNRQFGHGQLYRIVFITFFIVGISGSILSLWQLL
ncbi:MAG: hypothetical protein RH948_14250 [Cyclobacteriaceae bacterium]